MAKCGIIVAQRNEREGDNESSQTLLDDAQQYAPLDDEMLPIYKELALPKHSEVGCLAQQLWHLAEKSKGLSGRTLRDLPEDSVSVYTTQDPCLIGEALVALARGVEERLMTDESL